MGDDGWMMRVQEAVDGQLRAGFLVNILGNAQNRLCGRKGEKSVRYVAERQVTLEGLLNTCGDEYAYKSS